MNIKQYFSELIRFPFTLDGVIRLLPQKERVLHHRTNQRIRKVLSLRNNHPNEHNLLRILMPMMFALLMIRVKQEKDFGIIQREQL